MNITASSSSSAVIAGGTLTLICTATSNHIPHLMWIGPNGPAVDGNGTTVSEQIRDGLESSMLLVIDPVRTSLAGYYTCISNIEGSLSEKQAQYLVTVESKTCSSKS